MMKKAIKCKILNFDNKGRVWLLIGLLVLSIVIIWSLAKFDFVKKDVNSISISQEKFDFLVDEFNRAQDDNIEIAYCIRGDISKGVATITDFKMPDQKSSKYGVELDMCSSFTSIGIIHIHPANICQFSKEDYYSFGRTKLPLFGVMCNEDSLIFINNDVDILRVEIDTGENK